MLTVAITNLLPLVGPLSQILTSVGTVLGQIAIQASTALTGPFWTQFIAFVGAQLGPALQTAATIVGNLFTIAASAFQQAYPLIKAFGDAIASATGSASTGVQGGALGGFFAYIKANAPQIQSTLATIAGAFISIAQSLAPLGGPALRAISQIAEALAGVVKVVAPLVKLLIPFAPAIIGIVVAFRLLYPVIKLAGAAMALFDVEADANPIGAITLAIAALVVGMTELVVHFKQVSDFLGGPWATAIEIALIAVVPFIAIPALIIGHWQLLEGFFVGLWHDITSGAKAVADGVVTFIANIPASITALGPAMLAAGQNLLTQLGKGLSGAVGQAGSIAKDIVNAVITGINQVVIDPLKGFGINEGPIHLNPFSALPDIPHLAAGGLVGGVGSGTSDSNLAFLSKGEFVMNAAAYAQNSAALQAMNNGAQIKTGKQVTFTGDIVSQNPDLIIAGLERRINFS